MLYLKIREKIFFFKERFLPPPTPSASYFFHRRPVLFVLCPPDMICALKAQQSVDLYILLPFILFQDFLHV